MTLVAHGKLPSYQLEEAVKQPERGVCIRRKILNRTAKLNGALMHLPYKHYDYSKVSHIIVCSDGRVWVILVTAQMWQTYAYRSVMLKPLESGHAGKRERRQCSRRIGE
jgi:hypothetical protein